MQLYFSINTLIIVLILWIYLYFNKFQNYQFRLNYYQEEIVSYINFTETSSKVVKKEDTSEEASGEASGESYLGVSPEANNDSINIEELREEMLERNRDGYILGEPIPHFDYQASLGPTRGIPDIGSPLPEGRYEDLFLSSDSQVKSSMETEYRDIFDTSDEDVLRDANPNIMQLERDWHHYNIRSMGLPTQPSCVSNERDQHTELALAGANPTSYYIPTESNNNGFPPNNNGLPPNNKGVTRETWGDLQDPLIGNYQKYNEYSNTDEEIPFLPEFASTRKEQEEEERQGIYSIDPTNLRYSIHQRYEEMDPEFIRPGPNTQSPLISPVHVHTPGSKCTPSTFTNLSSVANHSDSNNTSTDAMSVDSDSSSLYPASSSSEEDFTNISQQGFSHLPMEFFNFLFSIIEKTPFTPVFLPLLLILISLICILIFIFNSNNYTFFYQIYYVGPRFITFFPSILRVIIFIIK